MAVEHEAEQGLHSRRAISARQLGEERAAEVFQAHFLGGFQLGISTAVRGVLRSSEPAIRRHCSPHRALRLKSKSHDHLHRTRLSLLASFGAVSSAADESRLLSHRDVAELPAGEQNDQRLEAGSAGDSEGLHASAACRAAP